MSIYPVRLSEWFLPNDEMFATAVAIGTGRCRACFKRVRRKSVGFVGPLTCDNSGESNK